MVHCDGVPSLQLHNKLSANVVSAEAVESSRVAHSDSMKHDRPNTQLLLDCIPCFLDLVSIVIDVDLVIVSTVGDHLSTHHHTVRSRLTSCEDSRLEVQRSTLD